MRTGLAQIVTNKWRRMESPANYSPLIEFPPNREKAGEFIKLIAILDPQISVCP